MENSQPVQPFIDEQMTDGADEAEGNTASAAEDPLPMDASDALVAKSSRTKTSQKSEVPTKSSSKNPPAEVPQQETTEHDQAESRSASRSRRSRNNTTGDKPEVAEPLSKPARKLPKVCTPLGALALHHLCCALPPRLKCCGLVPLYLS